MSDAPSNSPQALRPHDYVEIDGMLCHRRWMNPDGTRKTGRELRLEQARAEIDGMAKRILALAGELAEK